MQELCLCCGTEGMNHTPGNCQAPEDESYGYIMIYFLNQEFFDDLFANNICFVCRDKGHSPNHTDWKYLDKLCLLKSHGFTGTFQFAEMSYL